MSQRRETVLRDILKRQGQALRASAWLTARANVDHPCQHHVIVVRGLIKEVVNKLSTKKLARHTKTHLSWAGHLFQVQQDISARELNASESFVIR